MERCSTTLVCAMKATTWNSSLNLLHSVLVNLLVSPSTSQPSVFQSDTSPGGLFSTLSWSAAVHQLLSPSDTVHSTNTPFWVAMWVVCAVQLLSHVSTFVLQRSASVAVVQKFTATPTTRQRERLFLSCCCRLACSCSTFVYAKCPRLASRNDQTHRLRPTLILFFWTS